MKDKNGLELIVGSAVVVPDPRGDDLWSHSFQGVVRDLRCEYAIVEDGDGDCWEVETARLEGTI